MSLLKANEYKRVELVESSGPQPYVTKRYSGHGPEHCRRNASYSFQALLFLQTQFAGIVHTPKPYSLDESEFEVSMEYLPRLAGAKKLTLANIDRARRFFEKCYDHRVPLEGLSNIRGSVMLTASTEKLLDANFPSALGFRGDLAENLLNDAQGLILADVDTICVEPIGLSELILHGALHSSARNLVAYPRSHFSPPVPVVCAWLSEHQFEQLGEAAADVLERNMGFHATRLRSVRVGLIRKAFERIGEIQYSRGGVG